MAKATYRKNFAELESLSGVGVMSQWLELKAESLHIEL